MEFPECAGVATFCPILVANGITACWTRLSGTVRHGLDPASGIRHELAELRRRAGAVVEHYVSQAIAGANTLCEQGVMHKLPPCRSHAPRRGSGTG